MAQPLGGKLAMAEIEDNPERSLLPDAVPAPQFITDQPSYARTLFLGSDGLRSGWAFAVYLAMFLPLFWLSGYAVGSLSLGSAGRLWSLLLQEVANFVAALIPALVLWRIEGRPWAAYGLPVGRAFGQQFWRGTIWGFAAISLLLGSLYGLHDFDPGHLALHGVRIAKFAVFWAVMFLFVGFFEEFLLRGYTQCTLARGVGYWPAAIALSCIFGLIHLGNGGESPPGILAVVYIGLFFCLTLRRTGDLWFAVGFHAAWDWGETFFYSVPDSGGIFPGHLLQSSFHGSRWLTGGSAGPEGSLLCFVVIGVAAVAFERTHRDVKYPI